MQRVAIIGARISVYGVFGALIGGLCGWVILPSLPFLLFASVLFARLSATSLVVAITLTALAAGLGSEVGRAMSRGATWPDTRRLVLTMLLVAMLLSGSAYLFSMRWYLDIVTSLIVLAALLTFAAASGILTQGRASQAAPPPGYVAIWLGPLSGVVFGVGLGISYLVEYSTSCPSHTCGLDFGPLFGLFLGLLDGFIYGMLLCLVVASILGIGRLINQRWLSPWS
ncbi:MAG: hypothetical protein OJF49_001963 [Ktedonobacterales bacterium]|jgi:uncharacterized membrane protein YfcA|nr:MAG: hypothetical protein OJF49_001963 [Ktedonobacterales bacterium]